MLEENSFEERYAKGEIPWDLGRVDANLVAMVEKMPIAGCRALDLGCGTGDNSIWLARQAFDVTGVDISTLAIKQARSKALQNGVECRFVVADFLKERVGEAPFDFVFDRGCFHSLDSQQQHALFAQNVSIHLDHEGVWLSLIASTDAPQRDPGPPRLSAAEIAIAVEPFFEILSLVSGNLDSDRSDPVRCWVCVMKKRGG
ncbi:class I SAM-dependent methyltransferase [Prosthecochloris sp. SCSIO W1103]|uniref:class I SAM-dependent methyltransferase n=1 Tax=Prosthecochloris sp. SCSIO W1103 TaxID=2992244 RepID=UPI00223DF18D|nr:class I SAM-dependent methyltransferase [Prosthecochloris sp. SCSIO W1103]UZJ38505.1 methyltransferase domain-containing protein [Prosthecochloris sp. SCSIO W1103]